MIGRTLSHYQIREEISRGGMGVVYRALDTKLDREVAVKILPPELMADETRRRRFVLEAKAAAAIHHPHIATIHEIDEVEGTHFIVMELIDGEKLSDVLTRERLSVSRTLELAAELAEGLAKAHEKHVVHRDLKPANVMITEGGHVKIIDFGLAKLVEPFRPMAGGGSEAETGHRGETDPGQILGTVSYMSPEQARGEAVDERADIFSFGIVLYEMLTGTLPFRGKSGTDTLSAILRDPTPRLTGIESSEELQHVVNRCLAKRPDERYQTTKDLLADIRRIKRDTESGTRAVAAPPRRRTFLALGVLISALVVVSGLVVFWPRAPERFLPRIGRTIQVTREPGLEVDAAISPDGKLVAYAAGPLFATKIYVKQISGGRPVLLTEDLTGRHRLPRWSPDGARISFRRSLPEAWEIYSIPALGGAPRRFPTPEYTVELVWSPDGEHVAYPAGDAIFVGTAEGAGARKLMDSVEPWSLSWSSDGNRIAFTSGNLGYVGNLNVAPSSIWVVDVESGEPVRVTDDAHQNVSPVWAPDGKSLLFVSDRGGGRDVYRISVDPSGQPLGDSERLTTGLDVYTISSSSDGRTISYSVARVRQNVWSLPVPEEGPVSVQNARPVTTGNQVVEAVAVSPDGKWLVFDLNHSGNVSLFKMPVEGREPVQVTDGPMDFYPTWSPDGREIAFHAMRTDNRDIFVVSADGGAVRQLTNDPAQEFYPHWSPDGTRVVYQSYGSGRSGIYVLSKDRGELSGEMPVQLTFDEGIAARWSPDGRLIAYGSDRGMSVIASDGGHPRRLTDFGNRPMWSRDSQTIYFRESPPDERVGIWSVSVSGGEPQRLVRFDDPTRQPYFPEWSSDGEDFYFTLTEFEADVWVMEIEDSTK